MKNRILPVLAGNFIPGLSKAAIYSLLFLLSISNKSFAQCPAAPTVTSPVTLCQNTTASALTATGSSLSWGGSAGTVGGTNTLSSVSYVDATSNNKKTNFTTYNANIRINTVDFFIPSYQSVNGLVLSIYNNSGTIIATSSTTTTQTAGASTVKITSTFNYTIASAGNYSIGVSSGSGNIGTDNPSFPITESSSNVSITGVSNAGNRGYNNIVFTSMGTSTAPVPSTTTVGTTNYTVTQTANGCTSSPATIVVNVVATMGSAPTVTSPVTLCKNTTASALTATGSNLLWSGAGGTIGSVGGTNSFSTYAYTDGSVSNNKKTNFTTTATTTINTIDYYVTPYQSVNNLVLALYNNAGTIIATSSTTTTVTAGASAVRVTNTFNYTLSTPGNYSIGAASGSGNIGYDSPSFPLTESSGTINITGVSSSGIRCFNNIIFTINASSTAPVPVTTTVGTTNYSVTQTINGCKSPAATITVNVTATGGSAPSVTSPVNYCQNATPSTLTASGSNLLWTGVPTQAVVGGTSTFSSYAYVDATFNNKKTNFTTTSNNITISSVDYFITANQSVSGLVLSIFDNTGTIIATSSTNTTQTAGASAVRVTNTFNYTIATAGNYSIGLSAGTGNIGYDSPSYPLTESSGTINITGVSVSNYRSFNNLNFLINTSATAPTPSTATIGTTNYTVTQTVAGCLSPAATIVVNVGTASSATISYAGTPFCKSVSTAAAVTQTGAAGGTYSAPAGLSINSSTGAITPSTSTAGSYTVTYTVGTGCITTATTSVTITAVPSATISYASNPYCSNAGTATVTRSGTSGGAYTSTTGLVINASTGAVNLGSSTLGTYTVTYTVSAGGGCSQFQTTTSITIGTAGTWTGATNTNWANTGNWFCGQVPGITDNVVIATGLSNYPVVSTVQAVNNLTIQSGASVTIGSSGTLQIGGTINNSGTFNGSNGSIEMKGTSAQSIPLNVFQNNAVNNLIINNSSSQGVSLNGALDVYGKISFSGSGMKLNTNDVLTLKATSAGTAAVGDVTGNTINGEATVEYYIPARKAWYLLSVPTNTSQTIKQTWQESATGNSSNPVAGYGIQITGGVSATWAANGFDLYSATPSMKSYNSAADNWVGITSTNSTGIKSATGYMAFIRGDRTANAFNSTPTQTILRTKGSLYTGSQTPVDVAATKFGVIGNPYASPVDMRSINKTGFKNFFYVWDPKLGGGSGYGAYQVFSFNGTDFTVTPGGGSYGAGGSVCNYIQSGQAFMLQSTLAGGRITFTEAAKLPPNARLNSTANLVPNPQLRINLFGINADNSSYPCDGLMIDYNDGYSNDVDEMDAIKTLNTAENLSVKKTTGFLTIESRHTVVEKDTVFINLANTKVMRYRFDIMPTGFVRPGLTAFLEDAYLHTSTPVELSTNGSYEFSVANIVGSYAPDRFRIVFNQQAALPVTFTGIKAYPKNDHVNVEWKVENELNIAGYEAERSLNGTQFKPFNYTPVAGTFNTSANYAAVDAEPLNGYNYYRIKSIGLDGKPGYSNIVKVQFTKNRQNIVISGNAISSGIINLQFNNMPPGKYEIRLFNNLGQKLMNKKIQYGGGTGNENIAVENNLLPGVYQVQVLTASNEIVNGTLIK